LKKKYFTLVLAVAMLLAMPMVSVAQTAGTDSKQSSWLVHIVQPGESLWLISNQYGVNIDTLKRINGLQSNIILSGQRLAVKLVSDNHSFFFYTVKPGDTPWLISQRFAVSHRNLMDINGLKENSTIYPGQSLKIPTAVQFSNVPRQDAPSVSRGGTNDRLRVTYTTHTVQRGDTLWTVSIQYGIPMQELLKVNNLTERHQIHVGQKLTVPVYNIPIKPTVSSNHGELLDWWTEAQYVWPIGTVATITDFYTKKSWKVIRSYGAFHADVEPLTAADTKIMSEVWGGKWSWAERPVIVEVKGRKIAASANGMPHSIQEIKNNNFNGHFCVHFLNSHRHKDNTPSLAHQKNVRIAAGR